MIEADRIIYALVDPREDIPVLLYIGCTNQKLAHRLNAHIAEAVKGYADTVKAQWICELVREDLAPAAVTLERVAPWDDWEERERYWIKRHAATLLNRAEGGRGHRVMPDSVKEKIRRAQTGKKQSPETVAKRKATNLAKPHRHTDEARARISAARKGEKRGELSQETKDKLRASMADLQWFTDGVSNRRFHKSQPISPGWRPGRS